MLMPRYPTCGMVRSLLLQSCWMLMGWKPVLKTVLPDYQQYPSPSISSELQIRLHARFSFLLFLKTPGAPTVIALSEPSASAAAAL